MDIFTKVIDHAKDLPFLSGTSAQCRKTASFPVNLKDKMVLFIRRTKEA
jgi:hypothetical protein